MIRDMKSNHTLRIFFLMLALFMGTASDIWADNITEDQIIFDPAEPVGGSVAFTSVDNTTRTVTITVTPAPKYIIKREDVLVYKLLDPANATTRTSYPISDVLVVNGPNEASGNVAANYTFVIPEDYAGALVSVTFTPLSSATAVVTANTLTYNQGDQELVTLGDVSGAVAVDPVTFSLSKNGTYTTDIPTGRDAGTYTVYYKVAPDEDHTEGSGHVEVTIGKAQITSVTLTKTTLNVGETASVKSGGVKAGDLTVPESDYTVTIDPDTGVGTHTVTVTSKDNTNYRGSVAVNYVIMASDVIGLPYDLPDNIDDINMAGTYILAEDIDASDLELLYEKGKTTPFTGTLEGVAKADGTFPVISGLGTPLFNTATNATIRNIILQDVSISQSGKTGSIACVANGTTRIYNCGILSGSVESTGTSSTNNNTDCCGGLVGELSGTARVINCYSYATIAGGNRVGGIVGYNSGTTTASSITTMVMNCMFYGDITGGKQVFPVYGGNNISNLNSGGLNNFNYYAYDELKTKSINSYNCALAIEEKYLNRIEFYRLLLNSNKKLAAYYASTSSTTVNPEDMAKWVLETADRTISNPQPYPILKAQGYYPSIINIDAENAPQLILNKNGRPREDDRNMGGRLGTLSVTIKAPSGWTNAPGGAKLLDKDGNEIETTRTIQLIRTDKDEARFNFNYDKVQLPYYNDYGTKNYTGNKVVTGWKITDITTIAGDPYTKSNYDYEKVYSSEPSYFDYRNYNFADRKSSNKDLYSVSGRVFSQGAYFDVPYGVTSITIEPFWGNAAYVSDEYLDVVCKVETVNSRNQYSAQNALEKQFDPQKITINGSTQTVYTSIFNALGTGTPLTGSTVYENAIVLVGNLHQIGVPSSGDKAFTIMSVDLDKDNEPDNSLIFCTNDRNTLCPLRFDFLNVPGMAQAQKPSGTKPLLNAAIFRTKGWFEITNTGLMFFTQYEYENTGTKDNENIITKTNAPLILLGGYIDQFVSAQSASVTGKTIYIHVGGNVLINSFGLGTHSDGSGVTPHVPVSVTGGDFKEFYLTGTYNQNATVCDDNAECYISGGRFGELAGAAQEQIGSTNSENNGNVRWQIYDADITGFYGGGVNDVKPVQGNITTDIFNSHVTTFCGGPKFGNMASGKIVTTNAEGCVFDNYFGAGYGGNSYSRKKYFDSTTYNFANQQKYYYNPGSSTAHENERGKYYNGTSTNCPSSSYGKKGRGVATDFDYELFAWTKGDVGARFFIKFVSFSLAQCNNVTSTLMGCIINENFYGGGSLGKVVGTVTSELNNCEVKGNVFGAGYSANLPKINVRDGGFTTIPSFNSNAGIIVSGVPANPTATDLTGTTEYEWKNHSLTNGSIAIETDESNPQDIKRYVYTDIDITKANLGSVDGDVNLTIKGNSVIGTIGNTTKGNVYGGGQSSYVTGADHKVTVNLQGNTEVFGNVYGGGDEGNVEGSTEVNIKNDN